MRKAEASSTLALKRLKQNYVELLGNSLKCSQQFLRPDPLIILFRLEMWWMGYGKVWQDTAIVYTAQE